MKPTEPISGAGGEPTSGRRGAEPPLPRRAVVTGWAVLEPATFDPALYITQPRRLRSMNRTFQLGTAAAVAAWRAAGLPELAPSPERAGVAAAVEDLSPITPDLLRTLERADTTSWAEFAEVALHQLHPFRRLTLLANMAAAHTSLLLGLQGPSFTFTSGPASGSQTVREAYFAVARGDADLMLCHAAQSPEQIFAARPGAEFAAAVLVENAEHAARRGARVWAELAAPPPAAGGLAALIALWPPVAPTLEQSA